MSSENGTLWKNDTALCRILSKAKKNQDLKFNDNDIGSPPCKLDFVAFCTHMDVLRISGLFRNIRFTPDDPYLFLSACRQAQQQSKARS